MEQQKKNDTDIQNDETKPGTEGGDDRHIADQEGENDNLADGECSSDQEQNEWQEKYADLNDSYLRLHADFDNYRKRTTKEKIDIIKSGGEKVLADIIPLIDDFERALESLHKAEEKDALLDGLDLIYSKFVKFLQQHGVEEIEAVGLPFDPDRYEAVTTIPVEDKTKKGIVVDCIQKGYQLNDKIIRYPKVIVGD